MNEKLFSVEIELSIDKEESISFLEDLKKFTEKHNLSILGYDYIHQGLYKKVGIPYINSTLVEYFDSNEMKRSIIICEEDSVGELKKERDLIDIFEIKFQKFDLRKKNIQIYSKLTDLLRKKGKNYGEFEGIHVNLDVKSFFPYVREIILRNENFFDYNYKYRKRKNLPEIIELYHGYPIKDLSVFCNFNVLGRTELRIFDSNEQGFKKSIKFLKDVLDIWNEGYNNYSLLCEFKEEIKKDNGFKYIDYIIKTTNKQDFETIDNIKEYKNFEDLKSNYKGGSFETKTLFSAVFDEYEKLF